MCASTTSRPTSCACPADILDEVNETGIPQAEYNSLDPVLAESDVLYVTRVQKERFSDAERVRKRQGRLRDHPRNACKTPKKR